jgi:hypothetical protein
MCFITHVATKTTPVLFQHMEHPPGTTLHYLQDQYAAVKDKFTLPHVAELQLAEGCGCCLRHVDYPTTADMDYHVDMIVRMPNYNPADKQSNHNSLADFLEENFHQDGFVEFFGYFNGDPSQPARVHKLIPISDIRHPHFHFHGGTLYQLMLD